MRWVNELEEMESGVEKSEGEKNLWLENEGENDFPEGMPKTESEWYDMLESYFDDLKKYVDFYKDNVYVKETDDEFRMSEKSELDMVEKMEQSEEFNAYLTRLVDLLNDGGKRFNINNEVMEILKIKLRSIVSPKDSYSTWNEEFQHIYSNCETMLKLYEMGEDVKDACNIMASRLELIYGIGKDFYGVSDVRADEFLLKVRDLNSLEEDNNRQR